MKKKIGLIIATTLSVLTMNCSILTSASQIVYTEECGDTSSTGEALSTITATFTADGTMTISGNGDMSGCRNLLSGKNARVPSWEYITEKSESIEHLVVEEGVTGIKGFSYCQNLKTVKLPESLEAISWLCFQECQSLEHLVIPSGVTFIVPELILHGKENLTLYVYKDSTADVLSKEADLDYKIMGDMNSDGSVDLSDATEILNRFARAGAGIDEPETEDGVPDTADVNQDETVGIDDATIALTYYASAAAGEEFDWTECAAK